MKALKRINLGFILAIIAVVGVIIYCTSVENSRSAAKGDIDNACKSFVELTNKYAVLPSENQNLDEKGSEINLENYFSEMQSSLESQTVSKETANIQKTILEEVLKGKLLDTTVIDTDFSRTIGKVTSYNFSGNQVTVTFNSNVSVKQKYNGINEETGEREEKIRENFFEVQGETITLEKVKDNEWKVVYANLQYKDPNNIGIKLSM